MDDMGWTQAQIQPEPGPTDRSGRTPIWLRDELAWPELERQVRGAVRHLKFELAGRTYQFWARPLRRAELAELDRYGHWALGPEVLARVLIWPRYDQIDWLEEPAGLACQLLYQLRQQSLLDPETAQQLEQASQNELLESQEARVSLFIQLMDSGYQGRALDELTMEEWVRAWVQAQHRLMLQGLDQNVVAQVLQTILDGPARGPARADRGSVESPMRAEQILTVPDPETGQPRTVRQPITVPQVSWQQLDPGLARVMQRLIIQAQEAARIRDEQSRARAPGRSNGHGRARGRRPGR